MAPSTANSIKAAPIASSYATCRVGPATASSQKEPYSYMRRRAIMYLSKFEMEWEKFRNPYDTHRYLWQAFSETQVDQQRFLYRIERKGPRNGARVLVQSQCAPT